MSTAVVESIASPAQFRKALVRRLSIKVGNKEDQEKNDTGAAASAENFLQEVRDTVPDGSGCRPVRKILTGKEAISVLKDMEKAKIEDFPKTKDVLVTAVMEGFCANLFDPMHAHEGEFIAFIATHFRGWKKEDRQRILTRLREAMQNVVHTKDPLEKAARYMKAANATKDTDIFRAMARTVGQEEEPHKLVFGVSLMDAMPGRTTPEEVQIVVGALGKAVKRALINAEAALELHRLLRTAPIVHLSFEEVNLAVFTWRVMQDRGNIAATAALESEIRDAASFMAGWMSRNTSTPFQIRLCYEYLQTPDGPIIEGSRKTFMTF